MKVGTSAAISMCAFACFEETGRWAESEGGQACCATESSTGTRTGSKILIRASGLLYYSLTIILLAQQHYTCKTPVVSPRRPTNCLKWRSFQLPSHNHGYIGTFFMCFVRCSFLFALQLERREIRSFTQQAFTPSEHSQ